MNSKTWLLLAAFLITSAGSTYWYACKIKGFCADTKNMVPKEEVNELKKEIPPGPLDYRWSSENPIQGEGWDKIYRDIISQKGENKILHIVGPYYSGEENASEYPNLGEARAERMRAFFINEIGSENIKTSARMITIDKEKSKTENFDGSAYIQWKINNEFVKELDGKTLIYFPYNSDQKIKTPEIVNYLDDLVLQLKKKTKQTLQIVGHTDSQGDPKYNYDLGMDRARQIKNLLVEQGIDKDRINAMSRGEEDPLESNDSEEGRQKNRRTEIIINN